MKGVSFSSGKLQGERRRERYVLLLGLRVATWILCWLK
jgi:hypothetical protein